jgi:hypothetical protein
LIYQNRKAETVKSRHFTLKYNLCERETIPDPPEHLSDHAPINYKNHLNFKIMKRIFFATTFTLAIGAAMLSGVPGNARPILGGTTITCNPSVMICASVGPVVVYGSAVIKPLVLTSF